MSFQIDLDKYERAYGRFLHKIQTAIQQTFAEEEEADGLTQADLARELKVGRSTISRRLNGSGNITIRSISDIFTAMGREPLSNFSADGLHCSYTVGGPPTKTIINILYPTHTMSPPFGIRGSSTIRENPNCGGQNLIPDKTNYPSVYDMPKMSNQAPTNGLF